MRNDSTEQVLAFISAHRAAKGVSPSFAEIATKLKFKSADTVTYHVKKLRAQGLLQKESGKARGLVPSVRIGTPIVNIVRVDRSDLLSESDQTYLQVDDAMFTKGRADWLVEIPDYELLDKDLLPGDLVAVKKSKSFPVGHLICTSRGDHINIGFARVQDGVRRIHTSRRDKQGQTIELSDGRYWGIVIGVIRRSVRHKPDFRREQFERAIADKVSVRKNSWQKLRNSE